MKHGLNLARPSRNQRENPSCTLSPRLCGGEGGVRGARHSAGPNPPHPALSPAKPGERERTQSPAKSSHGAKNSNVCRTDGNGQLSLLSCLCPCFIRVSSVADSTLFDFQQLDFEVQFGIGRNEIAGAALAIAEFGRNDEGAFAADAHASHAFVPALDHLADAELEGE